MLDEFLVCPPSFRRRRDANAHRVTVEPDDLSTLGSGHYPHCQHGAVGVTSDGPGCGHGRTIGRMIRRTTASLLMAEIALLAVGDLLGKVAPVVQRLCTPIDAEVLVIDRGTDYAFEIGRTDLVGKA